MLEKLLTSISFRLKMRKSERTQQRNRLAKAKEILGGAIRSQLLSSSSSSSSEMEVGSFDDFELHDIVLNMSDSSDVETSIENVSESEEEVYMGATSDVEDSSLHSDLAGWIAKGPLSSYLIFRCVFF